MPTVKMSDLITMHTEYKMLKYITEEIRPRTKEVPQWVLDFKMECFDGSKDEKVTIRMTDSAVMKMVEDRVKQIEATFKLLEIVL